MATSRARDAGRHEMPDPRLQELTSAVICLRCWTAVTRNGEANLDRMPQMCSHLGPAVEVVPLSVAEAFAAAIEAQKTVVASDQFGGRDADVALWRALAAYREAYPPADHRHDWKTTGRVDTGHQPPRREYECSGCDERAWTGSDSGPADQLRKEGT